MSELPAGMVQQRARVVTHRRIAQDHYLLSLQCPAIARAAQPGQFVHLQCPLRGLGRHGAGPGPLLRRPFSLYDVDVPRGTAALIYKVVGLGTEALQTVRPGAVLDVLGPLGTTFTVSGGTRQAILVGGGVGIPPLYFLAKQWVTSHQSPVTSRVTAFLGARTKDWMICAGAFRRLGVSVHVATDDGTVGHRGNVVDLLRRFLRSPIPDLRTASVYVCGPTPMMAAAAALTRRLGVAAQVSLEERMGCAMGVCMGCIVETAGPHATDHKRYQRVCTEGPVFEAEAVVWRTH